MSQASSDALPTQPEDYRAILSALCIGNWVAIAGVLLVELFIRTSPAFEWPQWGYFSLSFNLVLFEFAAVTFGVTMLLRRTAWLDRAPREALDRLHHLLLAVLVLDGLHLLGFLHTTGGLRGPMVVLVPPVLLSLYLLLPRREAHSVTAILVVALLLMMVLGDGPGDAGMLAATFLPTHEVPVPWFLVVLAGLLLALIVGAAANRQMENAATGLGRSVRRDPDTGLFTRQVLERRVPGELGRLDRSDSATALLMISFKNMQELLSSGDYATFDQILHEFANGLRRSTRQKSDTCARYDVSSFAALLPTASSETVSVVVDRIKQCTDRLVPTGEGQPPVELAIGVASTSTASHTDPEVFFRTARQALQEARAIDGAGHQIVARNL